MDRAPASVAWFSEKVSRGFTSNICFFFFLDGLGGIGMGLGPGGQPIDANHLSKGIGMGNLGPAGEAICLHWGWLGGISY